jgi:HEAT repeat protein
MSGCVNITTPIAPPVELEVSPIVTPSTFDEALLYMKSNSSEKRVLGMWAVLDYLDETQTALPFIVQNLYYQQDSDVRSAAARVLGELGPLAKLSVTDLLKVMQADPSPDVQVDIAIALGKIGDPMAVPALVDNLHDYKNNNLAAFSARSISQLAGENFPDSNTSGFSLNEQGVPLIVLAAQNWWLEKGQFQDWENK